MIDFENFLRCWRSRLYAKGAQINFKGTSTPNRWWSCKLAPIDIFVSRRVAMIWFADNRWTALKEFALFCVSFFCGISREQNPSREKRASVSRIEAGIIFTVMRRCILLHVQTVLFPQQTHRPLLPMYLKNTLSCFNQLKEICYGSSI